MYACGNCRAAAVGQDGRCAVCGAQGQPPLPPAPPMAGVDLRRGVRVALNVLLTLTLLALLLLAVARFQQRGAITAVLDESQGAAKRATDADALFDVAYLAFGVLQLATAALWVVWFRDVRLNAEVFAPGRHRFGSGWAVGSWFTPVVGYWFPKQIANDIYRASAPGGPQRAPRGLLNSWWVMYLVGYLASTSLNVVYVVFDAMMRDDVDHDNFDNWHRYARWMRTFAGLSAFGFLLYAVAGVLALLVIRQLTSMQQQRALAGPPLPPPLPPPVPYGLAPGYPPAYGYGYGPNTQQSNPYRNGPTGY